MATTKTRSWTDVADREERNGTHFDGMETAESEKVAVIAPIVLPTLDIRVIVIRLIGDTDLICHHWSAKAIKQMLDKQMGKATAGKEPKNPEQDYLDSLYQHPDGGYGFPTIAFKNAAVSACTSLGKSVTKVAARQAFHVMGSLVKIVGDPVMREDMVTIGIKTADIRYRAAFPQWEAAVKVRYNARVLTSEQVVNLFNTAGFAVGVGEWRPERDGQYGMFHVATQGE